MIEFVMTDIVVFYIIRIFARAGLIRQASLTEEAVTLFVGPGSIVNI